ncbi:2,3-bisphosphoglycerate-independent phosphoglycerate mutase [Candidatus Bathyarchaeota archaeon]|nr:2,3-bisphosphoglycerate-independent phosphoglycerate mutase [Candidatus Bathyarchaeota archaeon]
MDFWNSIVFPRESPYKIMLIILDGLADIPIEGFGNKTPLEVAKTPNLDSLASLGQVGLLWPYLPWTPLGSGPAHLSILGYDPLKNYIGRGPLEALGFQVPTEKGDVIIRLNFATVDPESKMVEDRRAGRISTESARELFESLNANMDHSPPAFNGIEWKVYNTRGYRGVIILKNASSWINGADPRGLAKVRTIQAMKDDPVSIRTAKFMNWFLNESHAILKGHPLNQELIRQGKTPANHLLSRGAGTIEFPEPFGTRYKFNNPVFISGYPLYSGLARFLGMEIQEPDDPSIDAKFKKACDEYPHHDITILHVKDPDIAGEDGNPVSKLKTIEQIDKGLNMIKELLSEEDTLIVTADHATPAKIGDHSGHPVPLVIRGPFCSQDDVQVFSERECSKGSLGLFSSKYLMNLILMVTLRLHTFGA